MAIQFTNSRHLASRSRLAEYGFAARLFIPKAIMAMAISAILSVNAQANSDDLDGSIDGIEIEAQETEIEAELRLLDNPGGIEQQLQLQGEHALDDRWSIGAELELEREPNEAIFANAAVARVKWRTPRDSSGIAFALQAGVGYSFGDRAVLTETDAFIGWAQKGWSVVSRFDLDQRLQMGAEPEAGYRLRVARGAGSDITIGLEAAGDIWTGEPAEHRLGPYLELPLGGGDAPTLQLGAFAGLNAVSPDMVYRMEIEFEF